ncbi:four helix bundle protein [Niabella ginsenosidivorans]|nr:four helix bundle protein [Niabella ginsenosidivorans]
MSDELLLMKEKRSIQLSHFINRNKSEIMFLQLAHTKTEIYKLTGSFVVARCKATEPFPKEEKFSLVNQIRREAILAHLNLAEGCSRKSSAERCRFFKISRGSVIEVDAALDLATDLSYTTIDEIKHLEEPLIKCYKQLSGLIKFTHY